MLPAVINICNVCVCVFRDDSNNYTLILNVQFIKWRHYLINGVVLAQGVASGADGKQQLEMRSDRGVLMVATSGISSLSPRDESV